MIETSPPLNAPADAEGRLKRAAELAEHLRRNPRDAKAEPEELAQRFGLNPAIVSQIQSNFQARTAAPANKGPNLTERVKELGPWLLKLAEIIVSRPILFQIGTAVTVFIVGFRIQNGTGLAIALWCGLQAWCLLFNPRFRYVILSSALVWSAAGLLLLHEKGGQPSPMPLPWAAICTLFGMAMAMLNLLLGGSIVILGGSIQIAAQRRRSAALSRQDLVMRMFDLQEQLATVPALAPKTIHPWMAFARRHPFLVAAAVAFAASSLEHLNLILFHVDPFVLQQFQDAQKAQGAEIGNVKVVSVAPNGVSSFFIAVGALFGLFSTAIRIAFGFVANSWKKVWQLLAGMFTGYALDTAWAVPAGAYGSTPLTMALSMPLQELLSGLFVILIVRFGVSFNRALTAYRVGDNRDEALIVAELLDIRHRLSANPALICVLVVDAAGSTLMKKVDDPLRVEYSFGRYQDWLGRIVVQHGGKVEIRTGDGAICAFGSADSALAAACKMQTEVKNLNETENKLDLPFRLRVALHAGLVQADLEKVQFTEVIDVAAHTEKHSPVGGIALTAAFIQALPSAPSLPVCATVDGIEVHAMSI